MSNDRLESNLRAFCKKRIAELKEEIEELEKLNESLSDVSEDRGSYLELHCDGVKVVKE